MTKHALHSSLSALFTEKKWASWELCFNHVWQKKCFLRCPPPPPCSCDLSVHAIVCSPHHSSHAGTHMYDSLVFYVSVFSWVKKKGETEEEVVMYTFGFVVWGCVGGSLSPGCVRAHVTLWVDHVLLLDSVWQLKDAFLTAFLMFWGVCVVCKIYTKQGDFGKKFSLSQWNIFLKGIFAFSKQTCNQYCQCHKTAKVFKHLDPFSVGNLMTFRGRSLGKTIS